jgi:hypothetical protein
MLSQHRYRAGSRICNGVERASIDSLVIAPEFRKDDTLLNRKPGGDEIGGLSVSPGMLTSKPSQLS